MVNRFYKTVFKYNKQGYILDTWDTMAKAPVSENISAAKMSRSIKNNVMFNDYFYRIQTE